jgi:hypothetical protein
MKYTLFIVFIFFIILTVGCKQNSNNSNELALLGLMSECKSDVRTGNSNEISVILSPHDSWLMYPNATLSITATVFNDTGSQGVDWTISNGTFTGTPSSSSATYIAPDPETSLTDDVTITATSKADATKTATLKVSIIPNSGINIQEIKVNGGPLYPGTNYANAAFVSVKICPHGSLLNCTTVDNILVDTGSFGLRVLESALDGSTVSNLTKESGTSGGTTLNNCAQFMDGSSLWGWVARADVTMATLTASDTPIQVVSDTPAIPSACGSVNDSTQPLLGANGILGVGTEQVDCGSSCATNATVYYYACSGGGCTQDTASLVKQVANPIINFSSGYNNGVILALPSVDGTETTLSGSMIFGITDSGTNNSLSGSATVFALDSYGLFTTIYRSRNHPESFIDSGSNGIFFDDHLIKKDLSGWYAPACTLNLTATNVGTNSVAGSVAFSVSNADTLFNTGDAALAGLAAPAGGWYYFDWGLPFFYGKIVYTSIRDTAQPGSYTAPYWAY